LLKWVGKEIIDDGRAPASGNGQTSEVPEMEMMGMGSEAPTCRSATILAGDVKPAAATEEGAPQPPEKREDIPAAEEVAPRQTEAATDAEVL
jgi:hypothetical protein